MLPTVSSSLRRWIALGVVLALLLGAAAVITGGRRNVDAPIDVLPAAGTPTAAPATLTNLRAA
ncbi:MAG TPA: hypothetical protein VMF13_01660 [Luteitalea sp.]|nr:hypothetical protein [Luteitalea sp.]